ncbi:hypothetical protein OPV22_026056 [Ensete ventricosum]|uniref:Uncharacterized protein n=1 Tax=Ensete ventricosum TaxID=4639 RepID=A0AAV8QKY2_ENSVE|nr:hypothetical protein OPV22_026056 [Ensete ventricosum]
MGSHVCQSELPSPNATQSHHLHRCNFSVRRREGRSSGESERDWLPPPHVSLRRRPRPRPARRSANRRRRPAGPDDAAFVSRRWDLTVLVGAAAAGSNVSPADPPMADQVLRSEDNFDSDSNVPVTVTPTSNKLHHRLRQP